MARSKTVYSVDEAEALLGWHWERRRAGNDWYLHKYQRRRKVHASVALALGWPIGVPRPKSMVIDMIAKVPLLKQYLNDGYDPVRRGIHYFVERDGRLVPLHPDLFEQARALLRGAALVRAQNRRENEISSAGARARKDFAKHIRRGTPTEGFGPWKARPKPGTTNSVPDNWIKGSGKFDAD